MPLEEAAQEIPQQNVDVNADENSINETNDVQENAGQEGESDNLVNDEKTELTKESSEDNNDIQLENYESDTELSKDIPDVFDESLEDESLLASTDNEANVKDIN